MMNKKLVVEESWKEFESMQIAIEFKEYLPQFKKWFEKEGLKLLEKKYSKNKIPNVGYGQMIRNGYRIVANMFAAWLVYNGITTTYFLIKNGLVSGGESIYTWLRELRK